MRLSAGCTAAGLAHAAFEHMADAEFAGDVADVDGLPLEGERRVARDHAERGHFRQIGCDILAYPVAEILLLGIAAHIGKGQDTDADFAPAGAGRFISFVGRRTD